jgi:polyhydroxyalkanoate synthesis regulator phasin
MFKFLLKPIAVWAIALWLIWLFYQQVEAQPSPQSITQSMAQSTANLQADIFDLRSQISQLRAEVLQLRQQNYQTKPSRVPTSNRNHVPTGRDEQILDRLATLAIEAKDRLNRLESRVTKLETRL